jgi:hypothetical protein
MHMKKADVFPSKYLKCADLNGKPIAVTIKQASFETLKSPEGKEQNKIVLSFHGAKKTLPLNLTNFESCEELCGIDTDSWPGHTIELYPTKTTMAGKTLDCIRIRAPEQHELSQSTPSPSKPPAAPPLAEEMDDSVVKEGDMSLKDKAGDNDASHKTHRVICKTTAGKVLWTKDMTADEYDAWLDTRPAKRE